MKTFKPSTIMAALISSGVAFSALPLYAQESPDTPVDEVERPQEDTLERIEVRGFSTSLIQSLNQKRFSDTVSEQISADDLGGLPDVSMAEMAKAVGWYGETVTEPGDVIPALKRALDENAKGRPAYLEFIASQHPVHGGWVGR